MLTLGIIVRVDRSESWCFKRSYRAAEFICYHVLAYIQILSIREDTKDTNEDRKNQGLGGHHFVNFIHGNSADDQTYQYYLHGKPGARVWLKGFLQRRH